MDRNPPRLFLKFFRWFCHPRLVKPIEGDLMELYEERVKEIGQKKANQKFIRDVLLLFRKDIIKPAGGQKFNHYSMFKHYLIISWRSLLKQKLYAAINIGGLSIGLTCFILIFLYLQHELSYDQFLENNKHIYSVYNQQKGNNYIGSDIFAVTPAGLARVLKSDYPEVTASTSIDAYRALLEKENGTSFFEYGVFASPGFFEVFPYPFLHGDPKNALVNPTDIVLTESLAVKMFGTTQIVGQLLTYDDKSWTITGILKDLPTTASIQFNFVGNIDYDEWYSEAKNKEKWRSNNYKTFLTINDPEQIKELEAKMPKLVNKYWSDPGKYPQHLMFEPYQDLHLRNGINFDIGIKGSIKQLILFSLVAALVLILASINYTNLAIARSMRRAKEVGLRKVIGARKSQVTVQFLSESLLISIIAFLIAIGLTSTLLPFFGELVGRPLTLNFAEHKYIIPYLFILVLGLGFLSGSYPALYMAGLKPVIVLKGKMMGKTSGMNLQRLLVIAQYTVSIVMIICSLIIYQQFQFINSKELGFDKEHIITIRARSSELRDNLQFIKNEWSKNPNIISVTSSQSLPTNISSSTILNDDEGGSSDQELAIYQLRADYDFFDTYKIELLSGRYFSRDFADSVNAIVVNETTIKAMGWTAEEAIGKVFAYDGDDPGKKVIGVFKDFHMHSMHLPIAPLFIQLASSSWGRKYISVKVRPENIKETITYIEETVQSHSPYPFDSMFIEDHFNQLYEDDQKQAEVFGFFTILSILIASLGLFGLAAFNINQRIKEVGIRKTLGATIGSIVSLVSWDFMKMVMIGFLVASPIAYYAISYWFNDFAYHTPIEWWVFGLSGLFACLIAFITISSQSVKAAKSNPVDCLRDE